MKSDPLSRIIDLFQRLSLIVFTTFLNVFVCFSAGYCAGSLSTLLLQSSATSKDKTIFPLIVACLVAIGVQLYIVYYHKIRNYINQGAGSNE